VSPEARGLLAPPQADRDHLEAEANVARARLVRTLGALDRRRHELADVRLQVRRHAGGVMLAAGVVVGAVGLAVAIDVVRARRRAERRPRARLELLRRLWRRPEELAPAPSFWGTLARRLALTALGALASQLAKREAKALIGPR
jgi:hypothetical protein